ncbi:MAG: hypothetical protein GXO88_03000 [Chlorobi bacterium]|nr:hypothetical protein [Chlorobiota bacterium]
MQKIWTEKIPVNWENTSANGKLSLHALSLFLVRAAINHAEHLDFGFSTISNERQSWVLFRLNLKIEKLPALNSKIKIITWPGRISGISASRGFEMYDEESGKILCLASSDWLIIDMDSRKPQRLDKYQGSEYLNPEKIALRKIPTKFSFKGEFDELFKIKTFYSDLDMNGHVIAHNYFKWLQDAIRFSFGDKIPKYLQMNYINECKNDEEISIRVNRMDGTSFMGFNITSGKTAFTAAVSF